MLNQVSLVGRLASDPDARNTQVGMQLTTFWVQALERRSDGEGASASQPERPVARQEAQPPAARERPIADNDDPFGD